MIIRECVRTSAQPTAACRRAKTSAWGSAALFDIKVKTSSGILAVPVESGQSVVFLGPNGSGKSRLGVKIEMDLGSMSSVHRVGAHRSLTLNTNVQPPNMEIAMKRLMYGYDKGTHDYRSGHRWQSNPATAMLSDFDHVVAALYADENEVSVQHRHNHHENIDAIPPKTKLDRLKFIWDMLLPHRSLAIYAGNIKVNAPGSEKSQYGASEMSDGERVILYLIGQTLLVTPATLIIIDEPELHINRSILARLWDATEASRPDCAFLYLTHDIEFAVTRSLADKYAVNSYENGPGGEQWELEAIPADSEIPDEVMTKIVGSRLPVLFIEGEAGSLDSALYRAIYTDFTIVPVGSCDNVIHTVTSFGKQQAFHRLGCAGLIDRDGRSNETIERLRAGGVFVLPLSEVENILLMSEPFCALAESLSFNKIDRDSLFETLKNFVLKVAAKNSEVYALSATKRAIDHRLKQIGLTSKNIQDLQGEYQRATNANDPNAMYATILSDLEAKVTEGDYTGTLRLYDNKGLLSEAARILGFKSRSDLQDFVLRSLNSEGRKKLAPAIAAELPLIGSSRSIGILAYGSLIQDPREEIQAATVRRMSDGIVTPFPVEFARSSGTRRGAPTLVPFENGERVKSEIFVLAEGVSLEQAMSMLWRRETGKSGEYDRPRIPKADSVIVEKLYQFHGIGIVIYTSIGSNIAHLTADRLAELAVGSAKAVAVGSLASGRDGISYLHNATLNGISTRLSKDYIAAILRISGCVDLPAAIAKFCTQPDNGSS